MTQLLSQGRCASREPCCLLWVRGLWPCLDTAHAEHWPTRTGAEAGRDSPSVGVGAPGAARSAGGRTRQAGSRGLPAGPGRPAAAKGQSPLARHSPVTGPGLSPDGVPLQASPPCARSATSNNLHCPAPPRSRPSPSSQPFTPPNPQGRDQEGPAILRANGAGRPSGATAAPGGPESRGSRPRRGALRLRPAPPRG